MGNFTNKLDADTRRTILDSLRAGNRYGVAASAAFVTRQTLSTWISKGKRGIEPYVSFAAEVQFAIDEAEETMVKVQREGSNSDDPIRDREDRNSARFWLVRSRSDQYGDQAKLTISVDQEYSKFFDFLERQLDEATYARVLTAWLAERGDGSGGAEALEQVTGPASPQLPRAANVVDTEGHAALPGTEAPKTRH